MICNSVGEVVRSEWVCAVGGDNYARDVSIQCRCVLVHCYLWGILYMENVGTCVWWICVRAKSIMYSLLVAVEPIAVKILVVFVRRTSECNWL